MKRVEETTTHLFNIFFGVVKREMGCVASKLEEEEEVVGICRERKQQLKLAVDRRYTLADAHYRYCQSLYGVSAAIKLFVARHSSPSSPFLITFPPPSSPNPKENVVSNPLFLQQTPSEPTKETVACESCESSSASDEDTEKEEEEEEPLCGYFYMEVPPPSTPSPQRDFGWDFFNPFNHVRPEIISGYNRISEEENLRVVREQEGIPDLEEDGERLEEGGKVVVLPEEKMNNVESESGVEVVKTLDTNTSNANANRGELQKGLTVIDTPVRGRELLEALKDIEDHFIRAYDSGKDVSRMLEVNRVQLHSNLEEIKGEKKETFSFQLLPGLTLLKMMMMMMMMVFCSGFFLLSFDCREFHKNYTVYSLEVNFISIIFLIMQEPGSIEFQKLFNVD